MNDNRTYMVYDPDTYLGEMAKVFLRRGKSWACRRYEEAVSTMHALTNQE